MKQLLMTLSHVLVMLALIFHTGTVAAYHDTIGQQGLAVQQTSADPGNMPLIIIVTTIIAVAALVYWKIRYNPDHA